MEEAKLEQLKQELRKEIKGEVTFDKFALGIYSTDASIFQVTPVALVLPRDEKDVISVIDIANRINVNIVPRGGGTSLGGQATGPALVIDFSKYMNALLEINEKEKWARVQPGIVLDELNDTLKQYGLHFAPDPATSSRATIGGMIGNNSSGTKSIVYGITRDHVLEARTLLSDGTILNFKERLQNISSGSCRDIHRGSQSSCRDRRTNKKQQCTLPCGRRDESGWYGSVC